MGRTPNGQRADAGAILQLIRAGEAATRADLTKLTGMARSTVAQRVDMLLDHGLVREGAASASTGGRPPATLVFNEDAGVVLAADLGATHARLAVVNLGAVTQDEVAIELDISQGPDAVLRTVDERFQALLRDGGHQPGDVRAVGVGVPGPVEFATGRPVNPPIMPGWDGHPIPERFVARYGVPVLVDNDVNIMAVGEHWTNWRTSGDFLFVKIGTGIGCGVVAGGAIYRGAEGAAGDIGHIRIAHHEDVVCECGNLGCLEAVAGGRALVRQAREFGLDVHNSRDIVALARAQNADVIRLVRQAGRDLGEVLASLVNALNPRLIVIGGDIAEAHALLFAGLREVVYKRSTPLATRHLTIAPSTLGDRAGIIGAAVLATEHVLRPGVIDSYLNQMG
jgi:predicted NBD/HSP70 family sugar kinase